MSTVVHHIADLDAASAELARVIRPGGAFLIRNSFPGRHDEVMLFSYFPAAKQVADTFPTVEHLTAVFRPMGSGGMTWSGSVNRPATVSWLFASGRSPCVEATPLCRL
jgi:hypothetical protein